MRRNLVILSIGLVAALLCGWLQVQESRALYPAGPLHALESAAQDAVLRTRNPERYGSSVGRDPRSVITLVSIDERSLAAARPVPQLAAQLLRAGHRPAA